MIARSWRGATRAEDADRYLEYLRATGLADYRGTPGNLGVLALRRLIGARAEFVLLSFWESEESICGFAGDDISTAVFYPEDDTFLVERDLHVDHFDLVFQAMPGA